MGKTPSINIKNNKPLCLAYVIERFPAPTEYFILNEIISLEKRGVKIVVLSIKKNKSRIPLSNPYTPQAIVIYPFGLYQILCSLRGIKQLLKIVFSNKGAFHFRSFFKQLRDAFFSVSFEKQLKNFKITHIHAHFAFIATDIGYILSKLLNINFSFTAHAQDIFLNKQHIIGKMECATFVLTCTKYNLNYLNILSENRFKKKLHLIYHGIYGENKSFHHHQKPSPIVSKLQILTAARLVEKKGTIYLLKAIKLLVERGVNISCIIIGNGPLKKELECFVNNTGINSYVTFLGSKNRSDVLQIMENSDIFALPSIIASNGDMDGLPNVLLEAMLMEIPVISTNISAIPELIENNVTGILVPEKDEKAIADAIYKLIHNPKFYHSIICNAKNKIIQKFNINLSTDKLVQLFQRSCKN